MAYRDANPPRRLRQPLTRRAVDESLRVGEERRREQLLRTYVQVMLQGTHRDDVLQRQCSYSQLGRTSAIFIRGRFRALPRSGVTASAHEDKATIAQTIRRVTVRSQVKSSY